MAQFSNTGEGLVIEILYPEFANLFGELQSINYLAQCLPAATLVRTNLGDEPAFVRSEANLVYLGSMSESQQELAIDALRPYKEALEREISAGTVFLFTGNAMELVEAYIENEDGSRIEGLGLFDTYARRQMMNRYNSLLLGSAEGVEIVGYKCQFSHSYGDNANGFFCDVKRGDGLGPGSKHEGLRRNNFIGTYILGPILVLNPPFTKKLMELMGVENPQLAFEETAMAAYQQRLGEYQDSATRFDQ